MVSYGSLDEDGPHRFISLNAWSFVTGTVWGGLGGMALWEEERERERERETEREGGGRHNSHFSSHTNQFWAA